MAFTKPDIVTEAGENGGREIMLDVIRSEHTSTGTARVLSYWKFQELATLMSDSCRKYAPFNASE